MLGFNFEPERTAEEDEEYDGEEEESDSKGEEEAEEMADEEPSFLTLEEVAMKLVRICDSQEDTGVCFPEDEALRIVKEMVDTAAAAGISKQAK